MLKRQFKACKLGPVVWKPVNLEPYRAFYEVSNTGQVRRIGKTTLLRQNTRNTNRYLQVELAKNQPRPKKYKQLGAVAAESRRFYVHRLVALTFIPNPQNKPYVNHKDGHKANNTRHNLEWSTMDENNAHAVATGLVSVRGKQEKPYNKGARSPMCRQRR